MDKMVKVSLKRLKRLEVSEYELGLLEDWGVDSWSGYDEAIHGSDDNEIVPLREYKEKLNNMTDEELMKEFGVEVVEDN